MEGQIPYSSSLTLPHQRDVKSHLSVPRQRYSRSPSGFCSHHPCTIISLYSQGIGVCKTKLHDCSLLVPQERMQKAATRHRAETATLSVTPQRWSIFMLSDWMQVQDPQLFSADLGIGIRIQGWCHHNSTILDSLTYLLLIMMYIMGLWSGSHDFWQK